jgi:putative Holliday junction resolvase
VTRILGIDPGTRRCGIAITDSAQRMAFPRPSIPSDGSLLIALAALIEDEDVAGVVIGRPVALSGNVTASTRFADDLFRAVVTEFDELPVVQWDERLTTLEAQKSLTQAGLRAKDQRNRIDSAAAVIMLQNYLDALLSD